MIMVAPYAGAWIETQTIFDIDGVNNVAPYAGAWIETCSNCGHEGFKEVAPYAGAWIETLQWQKTPLHLAGRSLRGSVD